MKIFKLTWFALITTFHFSFSQSRLPSLDYVPQTPRAAAYSRYGEIPVDYSTGVPRIEIPIHSITVGEISIPITISYHASGIKVQDVATEVGLGFVLNVGGVMTANIVGEKDVDNAKPFKIRRASDIQDTIAFLMNTNNTQGLNNLKWQYFWGFMEPRNDYFSDRYYYSLCTGESGYFRRDFTNDSLRFMPYSPIKVNMDLPNHKVNLISPNGYKHYFTGYESFYTINKVVTEKKNDSIVYYYGKTNLPNQASITHNVRWAFHQLEPEHTAGCFLEYWPDKFNPYSNLYRTGEFGVTQAPLLDSLVTKNEVISFQYAFDRQDSNNPGWRLTKIVVKSKHVLVPIKVIDLVHSYFGSSAGNNLRLRLDAILISGSGDVAEKYSFNYNNRPLPPYPTIQNEIYYEDYWGYYNGSAKATLLPNWLRTEVSISMPFPFSSYYPMANVEKLANLEPDELDTKACILTQVNYPTGGKTIFDYEANKSSEFGATASGGLRVKKIISYKDATSQAFVKKYAYKGVYAKVNKTHFTYQELCVEGLCDVGCPQHNFIGVEKNLSTSRPLRPITLSNGAPAVYTEVTEYIGTDTTNIGKVVYAYNYESCETRNPMPPVGIQFYNIFHSDCGNYVPQLTSTKTYRFNNGQYDLIKSQTNYYQKFKQREFITGVNFTSKLTFGTENHGCPNDNILQMFEVSYDYLSYLQYSDTKGYEEVSLLTNSVVTDYIDTNGTTVETVSSFEYEPKYAQLREKSISTSDGDNLKTVYKYPSDFQFVSPYDNMVNRNIIMPVVEQIDLKDSTPVQSMRTNYLQFFPNVIAPSTIQIKEGANPNYEIRARYLKYDFNGNVLSVSKENDIVTSYLWGYNNTYPVAKIVGASYDAAFSILSSIDKSTLTKPANDQQVRDIINKIRNHPSMLNAKIYSFAYKPLVGMLSMTDANNVTTFYDYDAFNRLETIKDNNNNILKANTYHYKKQ